MKVRTIFLVRHRLWQSPTLHPPSPSRPFLVFWTTCQEREALNVRGIRHHSWLSLLYRVFLPLGLCFPTIPQITVFTPWLFPPHYLYLLLFIFFTIVFVTICNCYYFYGLLFVFFTIVFVIICICYYLYWLLFVLFTSRPTSSSPPASSLPPSSPQYGGLPRKPGRQKHLLQIPG